jgi:hypothetical protein
MTRRSHTPSLAQFVLSALIIVSLIGVIVKIAVGDWRAHPKAAHAVPAAPAVDRLSPYWDGTADLNAFMFERITFGDGSRTVTIDLKTGKVTLPPGMTHEESAVLFWEAVHQAFPGTVKKP